MNRIRLRKFPVTTADGVEFLVTIKECTSGDWLRQKYAKVTLHERRIGARYFKFRRLFVIQYWEVERGDIYSRTDPDFIGMARQAIADYYEYGEEKKRKAAEFIAQDYRRLKARQSFEGWDGKL